MFDAPNKKNMQNFLPQERLQYRERCAFLLKWQAALFCRINFKRETKATVVKELYNVITEPCFEGVSLNVTAICMNKKYDYVL